MSTFYVNLFGVHFKIASGPMYVVNVTLNSILTLKAPITTEQTTFINIVALFFRENKT